MNPKVLTTLLVILAVSLFGCSNADTPPGEAVTDQPVIVDAVPDELFSWLSHELALDRGARVFSNTHEGYTYYVATAGNKSVADGEIEVIEKEKKSGQWSVKMEYFYPGVTERSTEVHFLIIRVPENMPIGVSIATATGVEP